MRLGCLKVLWLVLSPAAAQLCSWLDATGSWTGGAKLELTLDVPETVQEWNITFAFDTNVTFTAWKGDITKYSSQLYLLTNKCYNGMVYHCQCLTLGFLVRYCSDMGEHPIPQIHWNGVLAPPCPALPDCDDEATTPDLGCNSIDSNCQGYDAVCNMPGHENCAWCDGMECKKGCVDDSNCMDQGAVCSAPDHSSCYFCDGHTCKTGCSGNDKCPENYPICGGGGGPNLCGCTATSDCKVGYNCIEYKCSAPPGKVLLTTIKTYTEDCSGCIREGTIVMLLGERNFAYQTGVPCQTQILDLAGTQEYEAASQYAFTTAEELGGCYNAPLNAVLQSNGGNVTWVGDGVWTPDRTAGLCVDWSDDSSFVYTCTLDGPASGASGTVWNLVGCNIQFNVSCP